MTAKKSQRKWSQIVDTDSTSPPEGLFKQDAETIAEEMSKKKVSPKGIGSGVRMVQFYINRAGKKLPTARKKELEEAKHLLQEKAHKKAKK